MCIGIGGAPKAPPPPPLPPAPPPPPREPNVSAKARARERKIAALATGRDETILTSGLGLTTKASTAKRTLLG